MSRKLPQMPVGRIDDLLSRQDADRIGYTMTGRGMCFDCTPVVFQSRAALIAFCKRTPTLHALIKDPVPYRPTGTNYLRYAPQKSDCTGGTAA